MSTNHYDSDLSVNDCLAILLGLDFEHIRNGGHSSLLDEIEKDLSNKIYQNEQAIESGEISRVKGMENRVNAAAERYADALRFHTRIVGEVAKARNGLSSELIITRDSTPPSKDYSSVFLSRQSFIDWCAENLSTVLSEDEFSIRPTTGENETQATLKKLSANEKEKMEVLIAVIIEDLSKELGGKYIEGDHPNYLQLATRFSTELKKQNIIITGLAAQTLKKKLSRAIETKKGFLLAKK